MAGRTILFATGLCVVCSLLVSGGDPIQTKDGFADVGNLRHLLRLVEGSNMLAFQADLVHGTDYDVQHHDQVCYVESLAESGAPATKLDEVKWGGWQLDDQNETLFGATGGYLGRAFCDTASRSLGSICFSDGR